LRLKIFKKLKTASLNSEFTGSYKKKKSILLHSPKKKLAKWIEIEHLPLRGSFGFISQSCQAKVFKISIYSCPSCHLSKNEHGVST